jgi:hypothetical protein
MKLSTFLQLGMPVVCLCFSLQVAGQSSTLAFTSADLMRVQNTQVQTVLLSAVLPEIESRYRVTFLYRSYDLKGKRVPANLLEIGNLKGVLDAVTESTGLFAEPSGSTTYTLSARKQEPKTSSALGGIESTLPAKDATTGSLAVADPIKVKVKVLDETGQPLPGAAVFVKATKAGAATSLDGIASIDAEPGAVLVVSFVGYIAQEVTVSGADAITVTLQPDIKTQSEVVVVG